MELSPIHEEIILKNEKGIVNINGVNYYFKPTGNQFFNFIGYEQLLELCALDVDIRCVHYENVKIAGIDFTLSPVIPGYFQLVSNYDYHLADESIVSLYDLWHLIENKKIESKSIENSDISELLMYQIVRVYLFDLIFANPDRNLNNIVVAIDEQKNSIIYILDNELSLNFDKNRPHITAKSEKESYCKYVTDNNIKYYKFLDDLETFLNEASYEYIDLLQKMLNTLTPEHIKNNIIKVEEKNKQKHPYLYRYLEKYSEHYNNIREVVNNRRKR